MKEGDTAKFLVSTTVYKMATLAESFLADLEDLSDASASDRDEPENAGDDDVEVCLLSTVHTILVYIVKRSYGIL